MNIRIVQILEGGIDLETMQEIPRSVMLMFGDRQVTLPIADEQLKILMRLIGASSDEAVPHRRAEPQAPVIQTHHLANGNGVVEEPTGDSYNDPETGVSSF